MDELGTPLLSCGNVTKRGRVILGGVTTNCQNAITVGDIIPVVGHGSATKAFRQTGDSGGMSYTGVVLQIDHAKGSV